MTRIRRSGMLGCTEGAAMSKKTEPAAGKAIITYSRGWQSLAATRSLGKRGVDVVTGDEYRLTPASFSKYSVDTFRYLRALCQCPDCKPHFRMGQDPDGEDRLGQDRGT